MTPAGLNGCCLDNNNRQPKGVSVFRSKKMPPKIDLPEKQIVDEWLLNINSNTRSLAAKFNCSQPTISLVLKRHLDNSVIAKVKKQKISASTLKRRDIWDNAKMAKMRASRTPEGARRATLAAVKSSAQKRKGRPFSQEHKNKLAKAHIGVLSGKDNPNWRGGTSKISWRGPGWTIARREARKRDENTCKICGKTAKEQGRAMDVHHRISYFEFETPQLANSLDNLVCLCRSCHRKVENKTIACP